VFSFRVEEWARLPTPLDPSPARGRQVRSSRALLPAREEAPTFPATRGAAMASIPGQQQFWIHTLCCPPALFNSTNPRWEASTSTLGREVGRFLDGGRLRPLSDRLHTGLQVTRRAERLITSIAKSRNDRDASASIST
jgi:hypothetical protein